MPTVSDHFYFLEPVDFYLISSHIYRKNVIAPIDHTLIMLGWQWLIFQFYQDDLKYHHFFYHGEPSFGKETVDSFVEIFQF